MSSGGGAHGSLPGCALCVRIVFSNLPPLSRAWYSRFITAPDNLHPLFLFFPNSKFKHVQVCFSSGIVLNSDFFFFFLKTQQQQPRAPCVRLRPPLLSLSFCVGGWGGAFNAPLLLLQLMSAAEIQGAAPGAPRTFRPELTRRRHGISSGDNGLFAGVYQRWELFIFRSAATYRAVFCE